MTREEIEKAKEYQFAKAAMERRWGDESPIEAFEEGAEYGYKYAVEKAQEWMQNILDAVADIDTTDYCNGNDAIDYALNKISEVIYKFEEAMEEE